MENSGERLARDEPALDRVVALRRRRVPDEIVTGWVVVHVDEDGPIWYVEDGVPLVYRCYDDVSSRPLYVGVTERFKARMRLHAGQSSWWLEVRRIDAIFYSSRLAAEIGEAIAIEFEQPRENISRGSREALAALADEPWALRLLDSAAS